MALKPVQIDEYTIGPEEACFIIAEAGVNHNGRLEIAYRLIDAAAEAGADAVKFQSFVTEQLITYDAPKANYQIETTGQLDSQYKMLKALELSAEQQAALMHYCHQKNILYLCTPYENSSVDMLDQLDVAAFKVASTDTTNLPFLRYLASKGRPVILSTGMSTLGDVEMAVNTLEKAGLDKKIVILHCTSEYPAPLADVNLKAINSLQQAFQCPVGFSDHTEGIGASPWAVVIGANVIEKHLTLDRQMDGPDHRASLEPQHFGDLVRKIRQVEKALGSGVKKPAPSELPNKAKMQKSLVSTRTIRAGEIIRTEDIGFKRPGGGLSPAWLEKVVNRPTLKDIPPDKPLTLGDIDWNFEIDTDE